MRNIIAERVLGLPQDVRVDKDVPFREIRRAVVDERTRATSFFWPQSIAVLGASPDTHRIRGRLLHQLRENGFPGRILPINPSYQEIGGLRCYASIGAVGSPVDLALVAITAVGVAPALDECARAGVKNALIVSSGFAEEGGAARDMQVALSRT